MNTNYRERKLLVRDVLAFYQYNRHRAYLNASAQRIMSCAVSINLYGHITGQVRSIKFELGEVGASRRLWGAIRFSVERMSYKSCVTRRDGRRRVVSNLDILGAAVSCGEWVRCKWWWEWKLGYRAEVVGPWIGWMVWAFLGLKRKAS